MAGWRRRQAEASRVASRVPASERTTQKLDELLSEGIADCDARAGAAQARHAEERSPRSHLYLARYR